MLSISGGKEHLVQLAMELQLGRERRKKGNNLKMPVLMAAEPSWGQISASTSVRRGMSCLYLKKKKWKK